VSTPYSPYDPGQQQAGMPGAYPPQGGYGYVAYPPQQGGYAPGASRGYLQGGPVGFGDAVKLALRNIFTYQGRASRSAYWWFALFSVIFLIVAAILMAVLKSFGEVIDVIGYIGLVLTSLSLTVRRLHDTDRSGFWYFIAFVPFVGGIVLLVFTLLDGTPGPNRFG
jgi:uncharacterized membrane protein YhaH (DUF805 family)